VFVRPHTSNKVRRFSKFSWNIHRMISNTITPSLKRGTNTSHIVECADGPPKHHSRGSSSSMQPSWCTLPLTCSHKSILRVKTMAALQQTTVLTPIVIGGDLKLKNRIALAPLTRARSHADGVPKAHNVEYYVQRGKSNDECSIMATNLFP
jgi:NADH:flavin oxidoreductase / NADH oxidase family